MYAGVPIAVRRCVMPDPSNAPVRETLIALAIPKSVTCWSDAAS